MLIVKSIEIVEVERDPWELLSLSSPYRAVEVFNPHENIPAYIDTNVFRELIRGRRFRRPDGKEMVIGLSKQAEEIIGIQYAAWDNMDKALNTTMKQLTDTVSELNKIKQLTFWGRLKAVFQGYI